MGTVSLPFGPSTNIWSPMEIFTPFGSGMSLFPTLDINSPIKTAPYGRGSEADCHLYVCALSHEPPAPILSRDPRVRCFYWLCLPFPAQALPAHVSLSRH